jgi:hypothetical protein
MLKHVYPYLYTEEGRSYGKRLEAAAQWFDDEGRVRRRATSFGGVAELMSTRRCWSGLECRGLCGEANMVEGGDVACCAGGGG